MVNGDDDIGQFTATVKRICPDAGHAVRDRDRGQESIAAVPSTPDTLLLDWSINPFESSPEIIGQVSAERSYWGTNQTKLKPVRR